MDGLGLLSFIPIMCLFAMAYPRANAVHFVLCSLKKKKQFPLLLSINVQHTRCRAFLEQFEFRAPIIYSIYYRQL